MSLNLFGIRSAVFTESSTFSCTALLLVKYRDNSLDLLYNLGNPYVCASTTMLCRTRTRRGRTEDDVSPAHNQASTIGAFGLRHLHTYVSYCQRCEFLSDGKRQHFSAALGPDVHVSVSSTSPTRTGIVRTTSGTSQRRVRLPSSAPSSPSFLTCTSCTPFVPKFAPRTSQTASPVLARRWMRTRRTGLDLRGVLTRCAGG